MGDLFGLYAFLLFGLFTPGPNVILVITSTVRFGFFRTIPHILGIVLGVGIIGVVTGFGVGALVRSLPFLELAMKIVSAGWIVFLSYQLWHARSADGRDRSQPFTFVQAVAFQWVNPKIWVVTFAAMGFLIGHDPVSAAINLGLAIACLNFGVCLFWSSVGHQMRRWLIQDNIYKYFVRFMSLVLFASSLLLFL